MAAMEYARGRCPYCGRVVAGRADGIEAEPAARRFVVIRPHNRQRGSRRPVVCLAPGGYRRVPRLPG